MLFRSYPDQPCETLENLLQTQLNASIVITAQLKNIIEKAKEDVLMTRTKLLDSSSIEMRFAQAMDACDRGENVEFWYPNVHAGAEGVRWVENCVQSADQGAQWVDYK